MRIANQLTSHLFRASALFYLDSAGTSCLGNLMDALARDPKFLGNLTQGLLRVEESRDYRISVERQLVPLTGKRNAMFLAGLVNELKRNAMFGRGFRHGQTGGHVGGDQLAPGDSAAKAARASNAVFLARSVNSSHGHAVFDTGFHGCQPGGYVGRDQLAPGYAAGHLQSPPGYAMFPACTLDGRKGYPVFHTCLCRRDAAGDIRSDGLAPRRSLCVGHGRAMRPACTLDGRKAYPVFRTYLCRREAAGDIGSDGLAPRRSLCVCHARISFCK